MPALPHDPIQARSTKIVATIGNVSSDPAKLRQLHDAGVNVFRLNFSHGTQADQGARIDAIRAMEVDTGMPTCIRVDLQGPKFRVGLAINERFRGWLPNCHAPLPQRTGSNC